jgi:uncharacterized protein YndB with AHSA1/START domain
MTDQTTAAGVRRSVTVPLERERAFELFVDDFGEWWPKDSHHVSERPSATAVLEAREGGRWYERDDQGNECEWGRVLALERPARIVIAWQLSPEYRYDPDPAKQTEVEVMFEELGDRTTRVTLEHRGFEVHGDAGGPMRDSVGGEGGWPELLGLYAAKVGASAT